MQQRVACIQMTSSHDVQQNLASAANLIEQAISQEARLVILPEMFAVMGMDEADKMKHNEEFDKGPIQTFLKEQAMKHGIWLVGGTIPIIAPGDRKARAACLVFDDKGQCVARYDKIHLFDVNLQDGKEAYSESRVMEAGDKVVVVPTPFGRLGLSVCYDVRFPELFRHMVALDAEIIALPTAFTYTTGTAHWDILVRARAIENLIYIVAACQTGTHSSGRRTYGHSMIVNPWGEVKASLSQNSGVIVADINLDYMHQLRREFPVLTHRKL